MDGTKSLFASKTFWGALLSLIAIVAPALGLTKLAAWAADPSTIDICLQVGGALGATLAIIGRMTATKTIAKPDPNAMKALAYFAVLPFLGLCGCSAQKSADWINSVTAALSSEQASKAAENAKALGLGATCALAALNAAIVEVNDAVMGQVAASPALAAKISAKQATAAQVVNGIVTVAYVANATTCKLLGGAPAVLAQPGASQ